MEDFYRQTLKGEQKVLKKRKDCVRQDHLLFGGSGGLWFQTDGVKVHIPAIKSWFAVLRATPSGAFFFFFNTSHRFRTRGSWGKSALSCLVTPSGKALFIDLDLRHCTPLSGRKL